MTAKLDWRFLGNHLLEPWPIFLSILRGPISVYLKYYAASIFLTQSQQTQNILYNIYTTSVQRRRRWTGVVYILYKCFAITWPLAECCANAGVYRATYPRHIFSLLTVWIPSVCHQTGLTDEAALLPPEKESRQRYLKDAAHANMRRSISGGVMLCHRITNHKQF